MSDSNKTPNPPQDTSLSTDTNPETPAPPQPTTDKVNRWTKYLLIAAIALWGWHLFSDRIVPYSEHARVRTFVTPIVPQVSGKVAEVGVNFTQTVKSGDLLFRIEQQDYEIAVAEAKAALDQIIQDVGAGSDDIATSEAKLVKAKTSLAYAETEKRRYDVLSSSGAISQSEYNLITARVKRAHADVISAQAQLKAAQQKLGDSGLDNPRVQESINQLRRAQLNLSRTEIRAPNDGAVTNAIISPGQFANAGQPLMTFMDTKLIWVEAYLRENSLGRVKPGASVDIALDFAPGKVFSGQVNHLTYGVNWNKFGQSASALPTISVQEGWLRESQRFPVIITFKETIPTGYRLEGGQADVVIYTGDNPLFNAIAWLRIRLMAVLSYLN